MRQTVGMSEVNGLRVCASTGRRTLGTARHAAAGGSGAFPRRTSGRPSSPVQKAGGYGMHSSHPSFSEGEMGLTIQQKKERLRDFRRLGLEIDRMIGEYERLGSWAAWVIPPPPEANEAGSERSCTAERMIGINEEINRKIGEYIDRREAIHAAIEALEDSTLRTVMGLYYLNGLTWEQVAEKVGYEIRSVTRLHGAALEQIALT